MFGLPVVFPCRGISVLKKPGEVLCSFHIGHRGCFISILTLQILVKFLYVIWVLSFVRVFVLRTFRGALMQYCVYLSTNFGHGRLAKSRDDKSFNLDNCAKGVSFEFLPLEM